MRALTSQRLLFVFDLVIILSKYQKDSLALCFVYPPMSTAALTHETEHPDIAKMPQSGYFAVLSDIHSNWEALQAVWQDIGEFQCRGILCLGDVIGYGPEPARCVEWVRNECFATVMGNHEALFIENQEIPADEYSMTVTVPIALARSQLSAEQSQWVHHMPFTAEAGPMTLVHASLNDPACFYYIHTDEEAGDHFSLQSTPISFHGHTHVPLIWEDYEGEISCYDATGEEVKLRRRGRYNINVGSVGQPRDDDPRASYVLYDPERHQIIHRRVAYNIREAQARFRLANLPAFNSHRLARGC